MSDPNEKHTITLGAIEHICGLVRDIERNVADLQKAGANATLLDEIRKDAAGIFHTLNDHAPKQEMDKED